MRLISLLILFFTGSLQLTAQRNCGTHEYNVRNQHTVQISDQTSPAGYHNRDTVANEIITIPVVVHVLYHTANQNITNSQILSQLKVLNEDFRRLNSNIYSVPAAFRGVSADPLIQFCLAQQDPNGNFTTGINRYPVNGFSEPTTNYIDANYKPATIWDRNKYLNIWSCDISNSGNQILGYAQFPGEPISAAFPNPELTDGVVVLYSTV